MSLLTGPMTAAAAPTGPSATVATRSTDKRPRTVWVAGDSITARSEGRLRERLKRSVRMTVYIDGVGGRMVSTLDNLVSKRVQQGATDVMVLALGTNSTRSWTKADYARTVDAIPTSTSVVLVTVFKTRSATTPAKFRRMAAYSKWMRSIASTRSNVCVADWRRKAARRPDRLLSDGIHPSPAGTTVWVRLIGSTVDECA